MKRKKEFFLILGTVCVLLVLTVFAVMNWGTIVHLFYEMVMGVSIVKEYVLSLGIGGILAISLIIIVCFFFPVISSVPVQLASAISYGLSFGIIHVVISVFLASQLTFLFTRTFRIFQSPRQRQKQQLMEEKIRNSKRSIVHFLLLAYLAPFVPFLLIHTVAANSGIKWRTYALITLLGPIPDIVVTLWLGEKITSTSSPAVSFGILMLIVLCVVLFIVYKEKLVDLIFEPRKEGDHVNGEQTVK